MISHFVHDTQSVRIHDSVVVSRGTSKCHTTLDSSNDILAASELPPPGPDHYAARRKLWLTPRHAVVSSPPESSTSRQRLEKLLSSPGAAESDDVWDNGIEKVWKGLNAGGRFKRRLPMALIIKIVHAAWLRDDTWPPGGVAPEPDDVAPDSDDMLLDNEPPPKPSQFYPPLSVPITEGSSSVTTPWLTVNRDDGKLDEDSVSGMASR